MFDYFIGTKLEQYLLIVEDGVMRKIDYDPARVTVIQNTVKFSRIFRNKNENLHAAVKRKYQGCLSIIKIMFHMCVLYLCVK